MLLMSAACSSRCRTRFVSQVERICGCRAPRSLRDAMRPGEPKQVLWEINTHDEPEADQGSSSQALHGFDDVEANA